MRDFPLLKNAPITEAVIDMRVKLPADFQTAKLGSVSDFLQTEYPSKKEVKKFEGRIDFVQEAQITPMSKEVAGYQYNSKDGKQVIQAMKEGFTFSRLKPYISWEQLRDEARRLWKVYKEVTSPELITRVALRYINNLNIPMTAKHFKFSDYLAVPPTVPKNIPHEIESFFMRIVVPEPALNAKAIITQALEPVRKPKFLPLILDIDVFRFNQDGIEEDIWDILESLRVFKNKIFFNSISKKLEAIYNE